MIKPCGSSHHASDELIDLLFTVAPGTSLVIWVSLLFEALKWGGKFEWPKEVVGLLEVGSNSPDLVNQVLDA